MPNSQKHRGANPKDYEAFSEKYLERLRVAVSDMSWLLSKGYAQKASLKLVGDRFFLTDRQRKAVNHSTASQNSLLIRKERETSARELKAKSLLIDGYNLLITTECALSKAPLFVGLDGCLRDIASIHSTYRKVEETIPVLQLIGNVLAELKVEKTVWVLDSPISNSGRLKKIMEQLAQEQNWDWAVRLEKDADTYLIQESQKNENPVVSADSYVMENSSEWINLCKFIVDNYIPNAWVIDLQKED